MRDLLRVEQGGHNNQLVAAESSLPNQHSCLAYGEQRWQLLLSKSAERSDVGPGPVDQMITFAQTLTAPEIDSTAMMETSDRVDPTLLEQVDFVPVHM